MAKIDLNKKIVEFDFGKQYDVRIQHACRHSNIVTIRDLCLCNAKSFNFYKQFGKSSLRHVIELLERYDLHLDMTDEELDEYAGINTTSKKTTMIEARIIVDDAKWEQRRYEIAKEIFLHNVLNDSVDEMDFDEMTEMSLSIANVFINTCKSVK